MINPVTFFRLRRFRARLGAFSLPHEIVLIISSYLDNASRICLALTCRALYNICFPKQVHLTAREQKELFVLLERDIGSVYFCEHCIKLHHWREKWVLKSLHWVDGDLECQRFGFRSDVFATPLSASIPYYTARLFMNRHLYGPAHGIPVRKLNYRLGMEDLRKVFKQTSTQARIVDNRLLLLTKKRLHHRRGDAFKLRETIDVYGSDACEHLCLGNSSRSRVPVQLPELVHDKTTTGQHFAACQRSFRSCDYCLTDYCIDISWPSKSKGFIIDLAIYQELGDCRSPLDWSWRSIATRRTFGKPRRLQQGDRRSGCVVDRWNKGDGIQTTTTSEWVGNSRLADCR